jgi:zinc protease
MTNSINNNNVAQSTQENSIIYSEVLPGIHILLQPMEREACSMEFMYHNGGSFFENPIDAGKKHLLEHCIVARTKTMNHDQLKDWEFRENIALNAYTGPVTMGLTAYGYKGDFYKMFDMLSEVAFDPTFDQDDLNREKEIVLREISERRGDPNYKLYYYTQNQIFTPESLECHETLGSSEMVAQTTLEDFKRLHLDNIRQSHIIISICGGGIDVEYIKESLKNQYNKLQLERQINPIIYTPNSNFQDFSYRPVVHELAHEHAEINFYIPLDVNYDNKASRQILHALYMRYGGELYDKLRDEKQLVYGISSYTDKDLNSLIINMSAEIKLIPEIIEATEEVFSNFDKHFKQHRFEEFKQLVYKKQAMDKDQLGSIMKFMKNSLTTYGIADDYDQYSKKLENTTVEEIRDLYEKIGTNWHSKKTVIVSNKNEIEGLKI